MKDILIFRSIVSGLIFIGLCIVIVPFTGLMYGYSEGQRTGDIYKFSEKGIFWKSYEGEMYLGGMTTGANGSLEMEKFYFSIPSSEYEQKKDIIEKLKNCNEDRSQKCTVEYTQWLVKPIKISSGYVVETVTTK